MNNPYYQSSNPVRAGESTLIQRVSYLLSTTLLVTAATAWWAASAGLSPALFWPLAIGTFVTVFAIGATRKNPALSLGLLYLLSVLEGALMGPLLGALARFPDGAQIIGEAATLSAIIVAGIGTYVWMTNRDFSGLGKMLFWGLLALIAFGVLTWFVHFPSGVYLIYSIIGAAIFVGFTLYDFSKIKRVYGPDDYVIATVSLYLDFINLFWFLIQILTSFSGGSRSRD